MRVMLLCYYVFSLSKHDGRGLPLSSGHQKESDAEDKAHPPRGRADRTELQRSRQSAPTVFSGPVSHFLWGFLQKHPNSFNGMLYSRSEEL